MNNKHPITQIAARLSSETAASSFEAVARDLDSRLSTIEDLLKKVRAKVSSKDLVENLSGIYDNLQDVGIQAGKALATVEKAMNAIG